ncbi:PepSY-associated TM helix domain-containing protein [Eisenibacter elegans]|uniref:PepSY-associated TM helix domain-containing protein n=1 Tax=Eisenibacter elegans TaxID=997 RepID=UPI0006880643|nr:PepSY-associated TM helix domain-containing protein [Eisenibacter elegans]
MNQIPRNIPRASTEQIAARTRWYRRWHRRLSILSLAAILLVSITGILLAWKKPVGLMPPTQKAKSEAPAISLDSLQLAAKRYVRDSLALDDTIERIDIRPTKGVAKVRFEHHYIELQLALHDGQVLQVATRYADWVEALHDGSLFDRYLGIKSEAAKLIYSTLVGGGLLFLSLSGFWLWYNPRRLRQRKRVTKARG